MMRVIQARALQGGSVARPRTGQIPVQSTRVHQDDWDDLAEIYGREMHEIIRDLIRYHLRRDGAKRPVRPTEEQIADAIRARLQRKAEAKEQPDDGAGPA